MATTTARPACHRTAFLTSSAVVGGRRRKAAGSGRYRILYIGFLADPPIRPGHDGDAAADLDDGVLELILWARLGASARAVSLAGAASSSCGMSI